MIVRVLVRVFQCRMPYSSYTYYMYSTGGSITIVWVRVRERLQVLRGSDSYEYDYPEHPSVELAELKSTG
eukprot:scaffold186108_cov42-Prasinocladus_malaysianus.AAC.1